MSAMIGVWLRWGVMLCIVFLLPILLVRAQPHDSQTIRDLLSPPDCPAPCFMNIQPGVTTIDEAFAHLKGHPWVVGLGADYRQFAESAPTNSEVALEFATNWQWSQAVPNWINPDNHAILVVKGSQITSLSFRTTLSLGAVLLAFGVPDTQVKVNAWTEGTSRLYTHQLFYADACMWVQTVPLLPLEDRFYWPTQIILRAPNPQTGRCDVTAQ